MKLRKEIENERGQLRSKQSAVEEENAALHSRMQQSQQEHLEVVQQLHNAHLQVCDCIDVLETFLKLEVDVAAILSHLQTFYHSLIHVLALVIPSECSSKVCGPSNLSYVEGSVESC